MAAKLPTLVIVGRPNVGKSTLFNRIAGERLAVVEDTPGVTRDRLYAEFEFRGRRMRIVDTGGILFGDDDPLVEQIRVQAEVAMAEADVVLFVVDADAGLNPADEDLAERLRQFDGRFWSWRTRWMVSNVCRRRWSFIRWGCGMCIR